MKHLHAALLLALGACSAEPGTVAPPECSAGDWRACGDAGHCTQVCAADSTWGACECRDVGQVDAWTAPDTWTPPVDSGEPDTGGMDAGHDAGAPDAGCDNDNDGHLAIACGGDDCNDNDPLTYPEAPELCDGIDENCDGVADRILTGDDPVASAECAGALMSVLPPNGVLQRSICYVPGMSSLDAAWLQACSPTQNGTWDYSQCSGYALYHGTAKVYGAACNATAPHVPCSALPGGACAPCTYPGC